MIPLTFPRIIMNISNILSVSYLVDIFSQKTPLEKTKQFFKDIHTCGDSTLTPREIKAQLAIGDQLKKSLKKVKFYMTREIICPADWMRIAEKDLKRAE